MIWVLTGNTARTTSKGTADTIGRLIMTILESNP
jgi:hypothetical protein